jgi:hypothetical protein
MLSQLSGPDLLHHITGLNFDERDAVEVDVVACLNGEGSAAVGGVEDMTPHTSQP